MFEILSTTVSKKIYIKDKGEKNMNFISKKTRLKLMVQALVMVSIVAIGTGYSLMFDESIHVSALETTINSENEIFLADSVNCNSTSTYYLKSDGTVYQAGEDGGLLPTKVQVNNVKRIISGNTLTFFMKNDGTIWDYNTSQPSPIQVPIDNIKDVAIGSRYMGDFAIFLKNDGTVWGYGTNDLGQLGIGNTTNQSSLVKIPITNVSNISCGREQTLFTKTDGTVWATGCNSSGQLGIGSTINQLSPIKIPITNVKKSFSTIETSFFIKTDGTVWGCGKNGFRRFLGLSNSISSQLSPKQLAINGVNDILYNYDCILFLKTDKTIWSSGYDNYGILGGVITQPQNTSTGFLTTNNIPTGYKSIALGEGHAVLVKENSTVWACGNNQKGQLGIGVKGNLTSRTIYTPVGNLLKSSFELTSNVLDGAWTNKGETITGIFNLPFGAHMSGCILPDGIYRDNIDDSNKTYDASNYYKWISSTSVAKNSLAPRLVTLKNVLKNGDYTITVEDSDGGRITKTITINNIDTVAPTGTHIVSGLNLTGKATITLTGSDTLSGVKRIKLPNNTYVTGATANYEISTSGTYNFVIEDNGGNITNYPVIVNELTVQQ